MSSFASEPSDPAAREALLLLNSKKWPEAAIALKNVAKKSPGTFSRLHEGWIRALAFSGRRDEAIQVLQSGIELARGPRRRALLRRLETLSRQFYTQSTLQIHQEGLAQLFAGKYRLAREHFERALETEPDNVEILVRLGQALSMEKDYDSASERLRTARRLQPHDPNIRLWLGRALCERGELQEGLPLLKQLVSDGEGGKNAYLWFAEALFELGQRASAVEILEKSLKNSEDPLPSLLALARFQIRDPEADPVAIRSILTRLNRIQETSEQQTQPPSRQSGQSWNDSLEFTPSATPEELNAEIKTAIRELLRRIHR